MRVGTEANFDPTFGYHFRSVGCIFAELLLMEPLFTGKTDQDQLTIIFKLLGTSKMMGFLWCAQVIEV